MADALTRRKAPCYKRADFRRLAGPRGSMSRARPFGMLTLVLLSGCPRGTNPVTDGGAPLDFVGRACNVDAECADLRCDKLRHQCICLSDESCKGRPEDPVRYCNNYTGLCVTEIVGCTA